jgi:hypothetical protein
MDCIDCGLIEAWEAAACKHYDIVRTTAFIDQHLQPHHTFFAHAA